MAEKLHIVLFGGNTKQQDGPLLTTAKILKKRGCKVTIVTDTVHLKLPTKDGKTLEKKSTIFQNQKTELIATLLTI